VLKLSACVITKNEEQNLAIWLQSIGKIATEMIVVDTGSTDKTVKIAEDAGAKVYQYVWKNDFADAKNFALEKATGDWILFLDADEYFTEDSIAEVPRYLNKIHYNKKIDALFCRLVNIDADDGNRIINTVQSLRIFRNNKALRYQGKVHETLRRIGVPLQIAKIEAAIEIYHTGYSKRFIKKKLERNLRLLLEDIEKQGEKPWHYAYLADCYYGLEEYDKTIYYARQAIAANVIALGTESSVYRRLIDAMVLSGKESGGIIDIIRTARKNFPQLPEFAWNEGEILFQNDNYIAAEKCLSDALYLYNKQNKTEETGSFAGRVNLLYYRLAKLALMKNEKEKAVEYYMVSLQKYRYNEYALKGLYQLLRRENPIDIIACLKTIYVETRDDIKFISRALREYPLDQVYLYYTQKLQQIYKEIDEDLLTGGLLAAEKYEVVAERVSRELKISYECIISSIAHCHDLSRYQAIKVLLPEVYQHVMDKYLALSADVLTEEEDMVFNQIEKILLIEIKDKNERTLKKMIKNNINRKECSIIIVVHNHLDLTKTCIENIRQLTQPGTYEIIVVDNASTDRTGEWIKEQQDLKAIFCLQNNSFAQACNLGIQAATSDRLLIMHNDVIVPKGWLDELKLVLSSNAKIGAVCPLEVKELAKAEENVSKDACQVLRLSDFCMLIKREVIEKIGFFDEQFKFLYLEDVDFSLRMIKAGYQLMVANSVKVQHYTGGTLQDFAQKEEIARKENLNKFKVKWGFDPQYSGTVRQDMLQFINMNKENLSVLDIGCACGGNLMKIKELNPTAEVYGVELNDGAASIASCFGKVVNYDIEKLEDNAWDRKFDVILMGDILEHLHNPLNTLQRLRDFLEADGIVVASIPNVMHISVLAELLQGRWTYQDAGILDKTHLRFFTKQEIQKMMETAGFNILGWAYSSVGSQPRYEELKRQLIQIGGTCQDIEQYDAYQWIVLGQNTAQREVVDEKFCQQFSALLKQMGRDGLSEKDEEKILNLIEEQALSAKKICDLIEATAENEIAVIVRLAVVLYQNNKKDLALLFMLNEYKKHIENEELRYAFAFLLQLSGEISEATKVIGQARNMTPELVGLLKELQKL